LTDNSRNAAIRGYILFAFAVVVGLALLWRLREVLMLLYVSALFAVVLTPVVNNIMNVRLPGGRHLARGSAIALLLAFAFFAIAFILTLGLPPVIRDLHQFANDLPARIPDTVARLKRIPYADQLGFDAVAEKAENAASATAEYLFASVPLWMGHIFGFATAFVLCVYFMIEGDHAYGWFMSFLSPDNRLRLAVTLYKAELRMSKWLFGQATLMLILGVCSIIVFGLLGVRYFVLLGVLMGLMNIIPIAGGVITILLVGVVAALDSWTKMAGVFIFYLVYVNVENAWLTPRIMRSSVNLMGLAILISLIVGTELAGIPGALVAVPTAALIAVLLDEYAVQKERP
jgi:predicted PurR-regulated permease PerM